MSQTYVAQFVLVLALILPKFGVNLGDNEITTAVQGMIIAGSVVWTLIRRFKAGDINIFGARIN